MKANELDATVIDDARTADIPALVALLDQLFGIEQDFRPDRERQARGLALLLAHPERGTVKVARDARGTPVGMVSAQLVISTAQGAPSAWVEDMVVSPAQQGRGVGRRLLQAILEWAAARGATRAQLLVDMENAPALGYYRHLGWEETRLQARRIFLAVPPGQPV